MIIQVVFSYCMFFDQSGRMKTVEVKNAYLAKAIGVDGFGEDK
ncbi:hypothetical protein [Motiliproteus sp.]